MHADTVIALIAVVITLIIAVTTPWFTFRLALRQDQARWLREQRAQLYVDMLTEAYAEQQYIHYVIIDDETRARFGGRFDDVRLPPVERARLGARGNIFGSKAVNRSFSRLTSEASKATLGPQKKEPEQGMVRVQVGAALDELQAAIRSELGADRIALDPSSATANHSGRPGGTFTSRRDPSRTDRAGAAEQ
jgi:hypothetical protein